MTKTVEVHDLPTSGQRGPVEHDRRQQIISAADTHFKAHGYHKTSMADLGKAVGVSSAYIYRFFESKQAIGEAICATVLGQLDDELRAIVEKDSTASNRFKTFARYLLDKSYEICIHEAQLHEVVAVAIDQAWCTASGHDDAIRAMLKHLVQEGRASSEFERKTPIDEVATAIFEALRPFSSPFFLQRRARTELNETLDAVIGMVLRSLAP
jgi:AcrR family transcriptional regulator